MPVPAREPLKYVRSGWLHRPRWINIWMCPMCDKHRSQFPRTSSSIQTRSFKVAAGQLGKTIYCTTGQESQPARHTRYNNITPTDGGCFRIIFRRKNIAIRIAKRADWFRNWEKYPILKCRLSSAWRAHTCTFIVIFTWYLHCVFLVCVVIQILLQGPTLNSFNCTYLEINL